MEKKSVKKKGKTAAPKKRKTSLAIKTRSPRSKSSKLTKRSTSTAHSHRARISVSDVVRSASHSRPTEVTAYMAMGLLVMSIAMVVVAYHGLKGSASSSSIGVSSSSISHHTHVSSVGDRPNPQDSKKNLGNQSKNQSDLPKAVGPLSREFEETRSLDLGRKISYWSSLIEKDLEGRKQISQLASHSNIDDIAPIIPKKYDCTTYVETVIALARSQSKDHVVKNLLEIRYLNGNPTYSNRNHFPEADWIPNNQTANILSDITARTASLTSVELKSEEKLIDKKRWLNAQTRRNSVSRSIASVAEKDWANPVSVRLNYIGISDFQKIAQNIPTGTVVNLVHKNDSKHPVLIAHQGFLIKEGNQIFLRHASIGGKIRTSRLDEYLSHLMKQNGPNSQWPLIGVNLNQINASTSESNFRSEAM